jgi:hypothetical protein
MDELLPRFLRALAIYLALYIYVSLIAYWPMPSVPLLPLHF